MKSVNIYVKSRKRISTCESHLFQIVCNLCPGWLLCLMRMTSSKQGEFKLKEIFIFDPHDYHVTIIYKPVTSCIYISVGCLMTPSLVWLMSPWLTVCRMSGRKRRLPGTIEPSKEKRHCGADGCNDQLVGTSFAYHYRSSSDFDKLKVLRNLPRQLAEEELKTTDSHTAYMFRHNHSATNHPHWRNWFSTINWIGQKGLLQFIDIFDIGSLL